MKLKLKAITLSLALAATSGQVGAMTKVGDHDKPFLTVISSPKATMRAQDLAIANESSPSGSAGPELGETGLPVFLPDGDQVPLSKAQDKFGAKPHSFAIRYSGHPVQASPGFLLVANDADRPGSPATATRLVQSNSSVTTKFRHAANSNPPTTATFPVQEPDNWAMFLAGLLGVGAIARRRMSP